MRPFFALRLACLAPECLDLCQAGFGVFGLLRGCWFGGVAVQVVAHALVDEALLVRARTRDNAQDATDGFAVCLWRHVQLCASGQDLLDDALCHGATVNSPGQ